MYQDDSVARRPSRTMVLFDIDGTLLRRAGPHHRQALVDAVRLVAGVATTTDDIPVQGMLDQDILAWMLKDARISAARVEAMLPGIMARAQQLYAHQCPDLKRKVAPGVRALLRKLKRAQIPLGLVTGNFSGIAGRKLAQAGLHHYFQFGAFAEDGPTRGELARLAICRARGEGWISWDARIWLIGDHENDIRAARENGIRAIAVATGISTAEQLRSFSPDILLPDLRALTLEDLFAER